MKLTLIYELSKSHSAMYRIMLEPNILLCCWARPYIDSKTTNVAIEWFVYINHIIVIMTG